MVRLRPRRLTRFFPLLFCAACHDSATLDSKVPVAGLSLHVVCKGTGAPSVVLESGLGNDARAWSRVQPEVAKFTKVCAYDRAGLGSSGPAEPFLSKTRAREVFQARQQAQRSLSTLSENSAMITVPESSHHIPLESPGVVVEAIRAVVESSKAGSPLSAASIR